MTREKGEQQSLEAERVRECQVLEHTASDWLVGSWMRRSGKREIALVQGQCTCCPYTIATAAVSVVAIVTRWRQ